MYTREKKHQKCSPKEILKEKEKEHQRRVSEAEKVVLTKVNIQAKGKRSCPRKNSIL
jgi:hypothetical protein